jgi:PKD repeat protein
LDCSIKSDTITVFIDDFDNLYIGEDPMEICSGAYIGISDTTGMNIVSYLWSNNADTPTIPVTEEGEYSLTVTNINSCTAAATVNVQINGVAPIPDFEFNTACIGNPTQFTDLSQPIDDDNIVNWIWSFGEDTIIGIQNPEYLFETPGTYNVSLNVIAESDCENSISKQVEVLPAANPYFEHIPICANIPVNFNNITEIPEGLNITEYAWYINDDFISNQEHLTYTFTETGDYSVKLIAQTDNSCTTEYEKIIDVPDTQPSATPFYLISPANAAVFPINSEISFSWSVSNNSIYYNLIIAEDANFNNIIQSFENITDNSITTVLPEIYDTLYWKVQAFNPCNNITESEINVFGQINLYEIEELTLWLSAENVEIIDNKVSTWYDISGNDFHATQTNTNSQPLLTNNHLNGNPVLSFDGINDYMTVDFEQAFEQPNTYFIVWNISAENSNNYFAFDGLVEENAQALYLRSTDQITLHASTIAQIYSKTPPFSHIISTAIFNGTESQVFENGFFKGNGNAGNNSITGMSIGARRTNFTLTLDGTIAEIIFFNSVLSGEQRQLVENYLLAKYSPSLDLGPDIYVNYGFCPVELSIPSGFEDILWSTGDTTNIIQVATPGQYTVQARAFDNLQYDTINVYFNDINYPQDNMFCFGESITWDTGLDNNYSFEWSEPGFSGSSVTITENTEIAVIITDTLDCTFYSDTIFFEVDYYSQTASIGPADTALCIGNRLFLVSGADETVEYSWSTGSTEPEITIENAGEYSVTVTNLRSCVAIDTINISLQGLAPVADFSVIGNCVGSPIMLLDQSEAAEGEITDWQWTVNGIIVSQEQNYDFSVDHSSELDIMLTVTNSVGCSNFANQNHVINPPPQVSFLPNLFCENSQAIIYSTSSITVGEIVYNNWYIDGQYFPQQDTVIYEFADTGLYQIKLISISDQNCKDSITEYVDVRRAPLPEFITSNITCEEAPVYFINNTQTTAYNPVQSWYWNFGDGNTSEFSDPQNQYSQAGEYIVRLEMRYLNGCTSTNEMPITIYNNPVASIDNLNPCYNETWSPVDNSYSEDGEIISKSWIIDNNAYQNTPELVFDKLGQYPISLQVETEFGCKDIIDTYFIIRESSVSDFNNNPQWGVVPFSVNFTNTSQNYESILWSFGDGEFSEIENPVHEYIDTGTYTIQLISYSEYSCADTSYSVIRAIIPVMDVMIMDLETELINNYVETSVMVINSGSLPVYNVDMMLTTGSGNSFTEQIAFIDAGQILNYEFNTKLYRASGTLPDALCVEAIIPPFNGFIYNISDDNNKLCIFNSNANLFSNPPYPNPVSDILHFDFFSASDSDVQVNIRNSTGNIVYSEIFESFEGHRKLETDIKNFASGIYFLTITDGISIHNYKFVIN